jgi:hypothetical protein
MQQHGNLNVQACIVVRVWRNVPVTIGAIVRRQTHAKLQEIFSNEKLN